MYIFVKAPCPADAANLHLHSFRPVVDDFVAEQLWVESHSRAFIGKRDGGIWKPDKAA